MNDPSNPNFWQDAFLSASRAGLAGGTLGAGDIVFGTYRAISKTASWKNFNNTWEESATECSSLFSAIVVFSVPVAIAPGTSVMVYGVTTSACDRYGQGHPASQKERHEPSERLEPKFWSIADLGFSLSEKTKKGIFY